MDTSNKIINEIINNEKIVRYKELESIINENRELKNILKQLKSIQKEIVHAKEYKLEKQLLELENKYNLKYNSLFNYPLLNEYLDLQQDINNFLKDFSNIIETSINDELMAK